MKVIKAAVGAAGLSAMIAVVANRQMASLAANSELKAEAVVDTNGNLHVPNAYRTAYEFLGTWAAAADQGQGSQHLHVVYASPGTITAYRKDGRFPHGTKTKPSGAVSLGGGAQTPRKLVLLRTVAPACSL
jgi:hypothetical protein